MKTMGREILKELLDLLEKAGHKQVIMLSKKEHKLIVSALMSYDNLLKRLDGDWTEEKE